MPYQKPAVLTERTGLPGTPLGNTSFYIPTVIGKTLGQSTLTSRTAASSGDGEANAIIINGIIVAVGDTLNYDKVTFSLGDNKTAAVNHLPILSVISVSDTITDPYKREYLEGTDFTVDKDAGTLDFTSAPVIQPSEIGNIIELTTAGFITAASYNFAVTALDANGNETTASQYSSGANSYFTVTGTNVQVKINWTKVDKSSGYKIYGKTNTGSSSQWSLLTTITSSATTSYTRVAAITDGALSLPAVNSTKHKPLNSGKVFVSYTYAAYSYDTPRRFFDTETLQQHHGIGSELANAGRLVMGPAGVGNSAASMYAIAANPSNGDVVGFQDAIEACESIQELILMSTTSSSDSVNETLNAHCSEMSEPENAKERFCFVSTTAAVMADSDVSTLTDKIDALGGSNRCVYVVTDGGAPHVDSWQNTIDKLNIIDNTTKTTSYTLNQAVDGQWHAIASMGMVANLSDTAVSPTNKQVYGISSGEEGSVRLWTESRKDAIAAKGGYILEDRYNNLFVRHALTISQASVEDSELSIVLAEGYMAKSLRDNHKQFIGEKVTDDIIVAVKTTTIKTLQSLVNDTIIRSFGDPSVYQDTDKPTWVYVVFEYKPIYPLNVLKFEWGFDLSSS